MTPGHSVHHKCSFPNHMWRNHLTLYRSALHVELKQNDCKRSVRAVDSGDCGNSCQEFIFFIVHLWAGWFKRGRKKNVGDLFSMPTTRRTNATFPTLSGIAWPPPTAPPAPLWGPGTPWTAPPPGGCPKTPTCPPPWRTSRPSRSSPRRTWWKPTPGRTPQTSLLCLSASRGRNR